MRRLMQAVPYGTVDIDIEYDSPTQPSGLGTYTEVELTLVEISDAGVLILTNKNGIVSAVSPTGWTRVSKR